MSGVLVLVCWGVRGGLLPQYDLSAWETLRRLEGKYFGRNLQTVTVLSKYYCTLPPGNTIEKTKIQIPVRTATNGNEI